MKCECIWTGTLYYSKALAEMYNNIHKEITNVVEMHSREYLQQKTCKKTARDEN
jgi:hypothetical protein